MCMCLSIKSSLELGSMKVCVDFACALTRVLCQLACDVLMSYRLLIQMDLEKLISKSSLLGTGIEHTNVI